MPIQYLRWSNAPLHQMNAFDRLSRYQQNGVSMSTPTTADDLRSCVTGDKTKASFKGRQLTALPDWLWNLKSLTDLDISGNRLTELPDSLGNLVALTRLDASDNGLVGLPDAVSKLTALTELILDGNEIKNLPDSIAVLIGLHSLNVQYNALEYLPAWIGRLTALSELRLGSNSLAQLPNELANLKALTLLDVSSNSLKELPDDLGDLRALTELDISSNPLGVLPEWICQLPSMTTLLASRCNLTSLPETCGNLTSLTFLSIGNNSIRVLPPWLGALTQLTFLDISDNGATELPNRLDAAPTLIHLNLSGLHLTSLPEWIGELTALRHLNFSSNELTELPDALCELRALSTLQVTRNNLSALPSTIGNLTALTELNVAANCLKRFPHSIGNLKLLIELTASFNELSDLPSSVGELTNLQTLAIGNNRLTSLPNWIGELTNLTTLEVSNNYLTELPAGIINLTQLRKLYVGNYDFNANIGWLLAGFPLSVRKNFFDPHQADGNRLQTLPAGIGKLQKLTELDLNSVSLVEIPDSFGELSALNHLELSFNQITSVSTTLTNLSQLQHLTLSNNMLNELSSEIGNWRLLVSLDLSNNSLTSLPDSITRLTSLSELNLSGNKLVDLPNDLGNCSQLSILNISNNSIVNIPASVGSLSTLHELDVSANEIRSIPESLGSIKRLRSVSLLDNPLRSPLLEIAEDGTTALKAYLSSLAEKATELWISKLLVVGEGTVGKTSLIKSLVGDDYDEHEPTTHGIRIQDIELAHPTSTGVTMRLSAWDFGGQDIYHATHQFFLSDRSLFLLLWNSRQGWEHAKLPYWLDIIQARAPRARIILVATHTEARPVDLPLGELRATYPQIVDSLSVDNRTREGVNELRLMMAGHAAELPLMGSRWPASWVSGVDAINKCGLQYATPEQLYAILASAGVTDESHQAYLLRALHLLGDILYFDEDEDLRDTVIIRPQWVNGYIAKVLDSADVAAERGLLSRSHERQLWSDLDAGLRDRFLHMMEKFDLSYRISDHPTAASLVVERLPWDSPPYQEQWDAALHTPNAKEIRLRYQLNTLPPGVPTWFIAREHRFSTGTHWRTGALFQYTNDERVFGLVRAEHKDNIVELAVRGPVPQLFFSVLQDGFDSTLSRYQGLEVTTLVPCPCEQGSGTEPGKPCQHVYQYGPLLRRLEQGVLEIECELSFHKQNVAQLLFGIAPNTPDEIVSWLERVDNRLSDFQAEAAWAQREFLKAIRLGQHQFQALCPSVFTLTPSKKRNLKPGMHRLELRLYCEQPGSFHALPEAPYTIERPSGWLSRISPVLMRLIKVLKYAAPLVEPVLGLTAAELGTQLSDEVQLMTELVKQIPDDLAADDEMQLSGASSYMKLDADYRDIFALLDGLDPTHHWHGLSRVLSPEGQILWLCRDHAQLYSKLGSYRSLPV